VDEAIKVSASIRNLGLHAPKDSEVSKLYCAVPQRFLVDPETKQFLLIDPQARLAPKRPSPIDASDHDAEVAGETPGPPRLRTHVQRSVHTSYGSGWQMILWSTISTFVEYHFDLLQTLFLGLWRKTKDRSWEDASSSVDELRKELFRESFAQNLAPVRDWNLSMLCTALEDAVHCASGALPQGTARAICENF
jgi:hypothetical protein